MLTFPLNVVLLRRVWCRRYPPQTFELLGAGVPDSTVVGAQLTAVVLFGLLQPGLRYDQKLWMTI